MRPTSSSSAENPPRKIFRPEQVQAKKDKAVRFLRDVVADKLVPGTDFSGEELADEIEAESLEEYAERKKITMENPLRTDFEIVQHVLSTCLPRSVSPEERRRAIAAAWEVLEELAPEATELDELEAATRAVQPIADEVKRRCRTQGLDSHRYFYLPADHTEGDLAEWHRILSHVVSEMPADASDSEIDQRIRGAVGPLVRKIKARERRRSLVDHGKSYISTYVNQLLAEGVIERDEWQSLRSAVAQAVEDGLREDLAGDESWAGVEELVRSIVDDQFDLVPEDDEDEEGI